MAKFNNKWEKKRKKKHAKQSNSFLHTTNGVQDCHFSANVHYGQVGIILKSNNPHSTAKSRYADTSLPCAERLRVNSLAEPGHF